MYMTSHELSSDFVDSPEQQLNMADHEQPLPMKSFDFLSLSISFMSCHIHSNLSIFNTIRSQHITINIKVFKYKCFSMNLFDNEILFANLLQETLPLLFEQLTLTPILFGCLTFSSKTLPQIMGKL